MEFEMIHEKIVKDAISGDIEEVKGWCPTSLVT
jgi:hypothetical protein